MPDLAARVEAAFVAAWDRREDVLDELEALQAEAEATGTSREILRLTLASARLLRIAGRHDEATDRMDRVLAAWPGTDELPVRRMLLNYRGLIALDAGRLAEAVAPLLAAWRLAVEDDPASAAVAAMNLGMVLLELDDPSGAARWLDRATWPGQSAYSLAHVVFGRALVGRHTGDRAAVADAARTLQDLDLPEDPVGIRTVGLRHLVRGWQALDADDRDQAIASVEAALGCFVDGTSSEVVECRLLAARALASTDPTGALGHLRAVLDRGEPDGADRLHRMAADLHLALGDPAAAVPHLQRAAELARAPLRGLGRTLRRLLEQQEGRVHAVEAQLTVQNEALERANASLEVARAELERRVEVRTAALVEEVAVREAAEREASAASQAKTRFLATMSHELRTPLNAILGYTALLGEELQEEAHREDLRAIERAGGALLDLIEDLLDLTRAEAEAERLPMEAVDLQAVATEVVRKREGIRVRRGPGGAGRGGTGPADQPRRAPRGPCARTQRRGVGPGRGPRRSGAARRGRRRQRVERGPDRPGHGPVPARRSPRGARSRARSRRGTGPLRSDAWRLPGAEPPGRRAARPGDPAPLSRRGTTSGPGIGDASAAPRPPSLFPPGTDTTPWTSSIRSGH
jgi:tetratricopeptide (TPR) repeat protein